MSTLPIVAAQVHQRDRSPAQEAPLMAAAEFDLKTHNGILTVHNPKTGKHHTYRIHTARSGPLTGQRLVSLLVSPNLESMGQWQGFGFVGADGRIRLWTKYRGTEVAQYPKLLERPAVFMAKGLEYLCEGCCKCCNRRLSDPASIKAGYGPECRKSLGIDA